MKPEQCGFDGVTGVQLEPPSKEKPKGVQYSLLRGKESPTGGFPERYRNCFVWYYPDDQPAKLLYINLDGSWYELDFIPIENPFN